MGSLSISAFRPLLFTEALSRSYNPRCQERTMSKGWNRFRRAAFTALSILVAAVCQAQISVQRSTSSKVVLYAAAGPELSWYDVDIEHATLVKRGSTTLPANVQE